MTKLDASVTKNQALAAKVSSKISKETAWYVLHGQVSNNLGQPVISDFFVLGFDGIKVIENQGIADFIEKFKLNNELFIEAISDDELNTLHSNLPKVIDYAQDVQMKKEQDTLINLMLDRASKYEEHLNKWKAASLEQMELRFEETADSAFSRKKKKNKNKKYKQLPIVQASI